MTEKSLVKGAAVLAAAGIIVKVFGAAFRILLASFITDEGMAYYSPAYSIYAVLLVVSTSGIPIAISRMVSERYAIGRYDEADRVFHISRYLMIGLGAAGFIVLFFFAGPIASVTMPGSELAMRATAPALLLVPIMSSYRGYFQGQQLMAPTALSQTVEQIFRVVFGLLLALVLMRGTLFAGSFTDLQRGAAGGCFGASAGAVGGLAVMILIYLLARKGLKQRIRRSAGGERETAGSILKSIIAIAVPITIGATLMPLVNLVDAAVVNSRLLQAGFDPTTAKAMYGQLTGFCEPIVALPQVLMSAIVMSIVPMVAAANKVNDTEKLHETISLGLRMSTIVAFPCAVGLIVLAKPALMMLFFTQKENAANAAPCLQVLGAGFILLALITILTGILQGTGKQVYPVINLFIGLLVKVVLTWILVGNSTVNVVGAPLGTMAAYLIACGLDLACVIRFTGVRLPLDLMIVRPLLSTVVMGVCVFGAYKGLFALLGSNTVAALAAILVGVIVYGLMILKTKTILRDEMMEISFGRKLAAICDRLHLW
ncbi:MAG: polysaccharide biosynthesis protein [Firmicutes bacterium]|nr:polysaccharide biosynthesis protein [Bacillota bacterium]